MKNILLVMESPIQTEQLQRQLSGMYCVASCANGIEALETVKEFEPDVLVIDLMLTGIDGIGLLEHIWNGGYRPNVVAITPHISEYIISSLDRMEVSCLLRSPCRIDQLVTRIIDVASSREADTYRGRGAVNILASLGFKMSTSGFQIMQLALDIFIQNPGQKITSQLYPAVAAACNGTVTQVEKAIRGSVESAWKNRDDQIWRMYFPTGKYGKTMKPTNGEFLTCIARCVLCNSGENTLKRKIG